MKKLLIFVALVAIAAAFVPAPIDAQERLIPCGYDKDGDGLLKQNEQCGFCDIFVLINNIVKFFLVPTPLNNNIPIVPLIAVLLLAFGGFLYLVSPSNPGLQSRAKSVIFAVVIGFVITYAAWLVIDFILTFFGVVQWQGFGNWWQISC
ncbi:MAG: hypothetical protein HYW95_02465 [Candidatus Wildermuthbacteria bacterium]|nr:hypothetical protein [Candidatus Wildermuthbacteria bacterium]